MPRYKFGPAIGNVTLVVPAPGDSGKGDVEVAFAGNTPDGEFHFAVPAYDTSKFHQLDAVHIGLYGATDAVPTDPAQIAAAPHHFSAGCSALTAGGTVTVDATEAPEGKWHALAVLEFAE